MEWHVSSRLGSMQSAELDRNIDLSSGLGAIGHWWADIGCPEEILKR